MAGRVGFAMVVAAGILLAWVGGGFASLALAQAAGQTAPETAAEREAIGEARGVATELTSALRKLLSEELAKGGFTGAARVCSEQAQTASGAFSSARGASARRVSLRYRNSLNKPDSYEARLLREWESLPAGTPLPTESATVVRDPQGRRHLRYLQPIRLQAMCLSCHGETEGIPAEVKTILEARYPADLATGYKTGDLRGAVSVQIPLEP